MKKRIGRTEKGRRFFFGRKKEERVWWQQTKTSGNKWAVIVTEGREFIVIQREILKDILVFFLGWGTKAKRQITKMLYRERGRYGGVFGHLGVGLLALLGIVLSNKAEALLFDNKKEVERAGVVLASDLAAQSTGTLASNKPRGQASEYRVTEGDTVSGIAQKFGVSIDTIVWNNNLKSVDDIKPGQMIAVPPVTGMIHKVKRGETIYAIAKRYQVDPQNIVDYPFNSFLDDESFSLATGQELIIPDGVKPEEKVTTVLYVAQTVAPIEGVVGEGSFTWPTSGKISQRFSWYHQAVDIANSRGTAVVAAQGGTVVSVGWGGGYGNRVIVNHGNGQQTLYAHLSAFSVNAGQQVGQGQLLGQMGSTGRSTGSHLHFEIITGSGKVNPLTVLQ